MSKPLNMEKMQRAFRAFDRGNSGKIDSTDVNGVVNRYFELVGSPKPDVERISNEIMEEYGYGPISFDQLVSALRKRKVFN